MSAMRHMLLASALLGFCGAAFAQPSVPAVVTDPAPDPAHPARAQQVLIPTPTAAGPDEMNALFYLAAGAGVHPTVILFHGFPGNEQNLDVAQAIRRAGWNVLTLHYRGSWGSPGIFSMKSMLQDADAAFAYVSDPKIAERYAIDRNRIVVAGHSMGGFAAAWIARRQSKVAGIALIDAWDIGGETGRGFAKLSPAERHKAADEAFDDLGRALAGTSAATIADEIAANADAWTLLSWAPELARAPLIVIGASRGVGATNHAIAVAVAKGGGVVTDVTMETDHGFSDHRIALTSAIVGWLQALPLRAPGN
jgi:pimeloyl-ACP methyl ester carboxylesterase